MNAAGNYPADQELLTDDFLLAIPSYMPFGGPYRGKSALREAIPAVAEAVGKPTLRHIATTVGGDHVVQVVEFTLAGDEGGRPIQERHGEG